MQPPSASWHACHDPEYGAKEVVHPLPPPPLEANQNAPKQCCRQLYLCIEQYATTATQFESRTTPLTQSTRCCCGATPKSPIGAVWCC
jgi:hypothetical protein